MSRRLGWIAVLSLVLAFAAAPAFAQSGSSTSTITGVVKDKDGLVPGATVELVNVATGEKFTPTVTNESGTYTFAGVSAGKYKVTISMQNYKKVETDITVSGGVPATVNTTLEVGKMTDTVTVVGSSDLVRADTPTVSQTVNADFIQTLPRNDRNALTFLIFLPGVTTVGGSGGARNNTTIAGLDNSQFNITIDGITTSALNNNQGFFSLIVPRLDAVEEVTLTTAAAGADASGQGAIQVRFVTRSGTNKFETSIYDYMQHANFNSNTYFGRLAGLPVPQATNQTYGGRVGGPIILPGFDGRGKAFFFFNHEEVYNPTQVLRTGRTIIRESALLGNYTYGPQGALVTRNVLAIANASGIPGVNGNVDPTIGSLLAAIRAGSTTDPDGTVTELVTAPNTANYDHLVYSKGLRHTPTTNITVNLNAKNRLQGSYYYQGFVTTPDTLNTAEPVFPGMTVYGDQTSFRTTASISLRSTVSTAIVNEVRGGWQYSPVNFFGNITPEQYANQDFFAITLGFGLTSAWPTGFGNAPEISKTPNYTISDQFNWLKGSHSFQFGADYTLVTDSYDDRNVVPFMSLGFQTNFDPAAAIFTTANFQGATQGELNTAASLYALLTGRVSSITATGRLDNAGSAYVYNGVSYVALKQDDYSFYAQDTWRWKPTVTFTLGARYQFTLPMTSQVGRFTTISTSDSCGPSGFGQGPTADGATDRFCNMFNPGSFNNPGLTQPVYTQYSNDSKGYSTDFNNIGPVLGMAWRPNVQGGFLRKLLGDPELATINGGYTRSFVRTRLDSFLTVFDGNPGQTTPATRSTAATAFPIVLPGESWPILLSQKERLGPPTGMITTPQFPINATFGNGAFFFNPDIEVPWTDSWNVSFQRSITKDTVIELRYQGNKGYKAWTTENWNATNVYETAWLTGSRGAGLPDGEFEKAQANMRANVLAGRGSTMAYMGPGTGTVPLPITLAHLNGGCPYNPGGTCAAASDPSKYVGNVWSSTTFTGALNPFAPSPSGFASNLYLTTFAAASIDTAHGASTRLWNNALASGFPTNFWQLNPQLNNINATTNSANRPQNHLVTLQVRRRLAAGLAAQLGYTWQRNITGSRLDFHLPLLYLEGNGVPHAIQALWTYDIPVGRGKKYGANMNAWEDAIIGGWQFSGTARFQRQSFHIRDAVLVGMTVKDVQNALSVIRYVTDPNTGAVTVFNMPEDIYTNTRLAYAVDATRATYYVPGTEPNGPLAMAQADGTYRYFAPAGGPQPDGTTCNFVYTGDCGTQEMYFLGRFFGEMDFRLAKQFQLPGRARFEFSAEVFNATKALNFPTTINPSTSGNAFRMTTTQSGARTSQLVWRVSW